MPARPSESVPDRLLNRAFSCIWRPRPLGPSGAERPSGRGWALARDAPMTQAADRPPENTAGEKPARSPNAPTEETVLSVKHYTDRMFAFRITRPGAFRFRSGEFVMIGL